MARKYSRAGIEQLEHLFATRGLELELVEALDEELSHRNTSRARKLRENVRHRLATLRSQQVGNTNYEVSHSSSAAAPQRDERTSNRSTPHSCDATQRRRGKSSGPLPPITNEPAHILDAWIGLEVLSPPRFRAP
jgi:hypothetical protein